MKPKISLRDLCWLVLVVAMGLGWWAERERITSWLNEPIDRSWHSGTIALEPYTDGKEMGLRVTGTWPDATPDLWFRGSCWLIQDDSPDVLVFASTEGTKLSQFRRAGVSDYSKGSLFRLAYPNKPHRAVLDYEIWRGKPGHGKLLAKQCLFSRMISPPK